MQRFLIMILAKKEKLDKNIHEIQFYSGSKNWVAFSLAINWTSGLNCRSYFLSLVIISSSAMSTKMFRLCINSGISKAFFWPGSGSIMSSSSSGLLCLVAMAWYPARKEILSSKLCNIPNQQLNLAILN